MTPSHHSYLERAKLILNQYRQLNESLITNPEFLEARIATALEKAEADTIERCAVVADKLFSDCSNGTPSFPAKHRVAMEVAQAIRSLQPKEPR